MSINKILISVLCLFLTNEKLFSLDIDQLVLEPGFEISVYADSLDAPRQMAEGENGTIFVGERSGQIIALINSDHNGQADSKIILATGLNYSTGVSIFNGHFYF